METNLNEVKNVAKALLKVEPESIMDGLFVNHPFFDSNPCFYIENGECKTLDVWEDRNELMVRYEKIINAATNVTQLMIGIRKPYLLIFTKLAEPYLSERDFAECLSHSWTMSENPNDDVNVSIEEAIGMFRRANKEYLMEETELEAYNDLPETLTVYRGIANGHNPKGLSYTTDRKVAEWFANRYDGNGYVLAATIKKQDVLCYFSERGEEEVVVDSRSISPTQI